jgi:hypothetical protein
VGFVEVLMILVTLHLMGSISFFVVAILDEDLHKDTRTLLYLTALSRVWEPIVITYLFSDK